MKNFSFSLLIYFFLLNFSYALDNKLKVYYSGFSLTTISVDAIEFEEVLKKDRTKKQINVFLSIIFNCT